MPNKSHPIRPERYYKRHLKLEDQILEMGARKRYAAEQARIYAHKPDTHLQYPSTDAFRFRKMSQHATSELGQLKIVRDANLWRAEKNYEKNREAYQSQAEGEFFEIMFHINVTRMALEHVRPDGCEGCVGAKCAIHNLVRLAAKTKQPVRDSVEQFNEKFESNCEGEIETEAVGCSTLSKKCGHEAGAIAVASFWKD
ncbi:MAG: hypothetical protein WD887_00065 [Candidatus Saccharimonadales bacterium]